MDELMDALVDLYNSNESTDHDVFNGGDLTLKVESLACKYLISENGSCNWDNIKKLRDSGYSVYRGDGDSFGWLVGCIRMSGDKRIVTYG